MESVSEKTIEKYRYINVDHFDWWDYEYEDFKEQMKEQGICVDDIYFSGFWSQGDGACFEGYIKDTNVFLEKNFKPEDYPTIRMVVANGGGVRLSVRHSGHYYHENCTSFDMDADMPNQVLPTPTDFHQQVVEQYDKTMEQEIEDFEKESIEIFKNLMRGLYRQLETQYDYLVSDEAVTEAIIANELNEPDEGEE